MNTYLAVHFSESAATSKEFDTLAEAHNHLLFRSSLIKMDQTDLMAVYRTNDGKLMGTVKPYSARPLAHQSGKLRQFFKGLF